MGELAGRKATGEQRRKPDLLKTPWSLIILRGVYAPATQKNIPKCTPKISTLLVARARRETRGKYIKSWPSSIIHVCLYGHSFGADIASIISRSRRKDIGKGHRKAMVCPRALQLTPTTSKSSPIMTGAILSLCLTFIGIINRPAGTRLAAVSSKGCAEINKDGRRLSMLRMWPTPAWKDAAWGEISTQLFAWDGAYPAALLLPSPV